VENVCHTLAGGVLARAGFDRLSPLATATMLVASNLPDVDVAVTAWGDLAYLEHHRGVTHAMLGLALEAPLLAGLVCAWDRLVRRRRRPDVAPARFLPLLLVSAVGLVGHTLLDFTNAYGVKPWLPFDATWYYGDLVFIVDPWLWLLLGGALLLGSARRARTNVSWAVLFAAMATAVVSSATMPPGVSGGRGAVGAWLALLAALWAARATWRTVDRTALARSALVGLAAYWALLGAAHALALCEVERVAGDGRPNVVPTLMRPDRWTAFVLTPEEIRTGAVRIGGDPVRLRSIPRRLDDPAVVAASDTCPGAVAIAFGRFLFADVRSREDGGRTVRFQDARFGAVPAGATSFATVDVELDSDLRPEPDPRYCPKPDGSW
jgi:inner membrane protein